ncbi:MAG: hypothetical protein AAGJ31_12535, partial [Verrucomicrobiota bacterium]
MVIPLPGRGAYCIGKTADGTEVQVLDLNRNQLAWKEEGVAFNILHASRRLSILDDRGNVLYFDLESGRYLETVSGTEGALAMRVDGAGVSISFALTAGLLPVGIGGYQDGIAFVDDRFVTARCNQGDVIVVDRASGEEL